MAIGGGTIFFVEKREKVYWGAYSIVKATINGFEAIVASNNSYDFINLLSGQDYPIKPLDEIHGFLEANAGKAFMEFYSVEELTEVIRRSAMLLNLTLENNCSYHKLDSNRQTINLTLLNPTFCLPVLVSR